MLAEGLARIPGISLYLREVETNIVVFRLRSVEAAARIPRRSIAEGVLVSNFGGGRLVVTHYGIEGRVACRRAVGIFAICSSTSLAGGERRRRRRPAGLVRCCAADGPRHPRAGSARGHPRATPVSFPEAHAVKCDLPKMKAGGMDGVFLAVYTGQRHTSRWLATRRSTRGGPIASMPSIG